MALLWLKLSSIPHFRQAIIRIKQNLWTCPAITTNWKAHNGDILNQDVVGWRIRNYSAGKANNNDSAFKINATCLVCEGISAHRIVDYIGATDELLHSRPYLFR